MLLRCCAILAVWIVLGGGQIGWAQDTTRVLREIGLHRDTIDTFQPQPYQLRPFVLPGSESIRLGATEIDTAGYRLDYRGGRLWIEGGDAFERADTLFATYRTYPFGFEEVYRRRARDTTAAADRGAVAVVEDDTVSDSGFDPFEGVTLQRSGSISRGLVGGTNRDVNIESGLRMQLQGELAEDVRVRAVLTDQNTPIQPQGTTQRLEDFDRVFIELDAPQGTAQLGDVDVDLGQESQFARFTRKLQGATLRSDTLGAVVGMPEGRAQVVGAVSRGQFRSQDIEPIDGVQGPYRLTGENGEELIVIVAGSERVYLDGEQVERGRTNDYVIDYTRGEITFTANRLITDDRRITVEFQYRTSQFSRTLIGSEAQAGVWRGADGSPRIRVGARYLREADGTDLQSGFDLSREDSLRIVQSGDDRAVRSGAEEVVFDPEAPFVQYRREVVELPGGETDTAFVPLDGPPEPGTPVFRVRFTQVGAGQGAYVRAGREVNGILYEYQGPGQGSYAPIEPLPKPKKQHLVDLTGSVEPIRGVTLFGEWAQSLNDANRFSALDSQDDRDQGYVAGLRLSPTPLDVGGASIGRLSAEVRRQERGRHFETFNTTRDIEFGRRWNLARSGTGVPKNLQGVGDETLDEGRIRWAGGENSQAEIGAGRLQIGPAFESTRGHGRLSLQEFGVPRVDVQTEVVSSTDRVQGVDGRWLRQQGTLRQPFWGGRLEPRLRIDHERRLQRLEAADSLTGASFAFWEVEPSMQLETDPVTASAGVEYRTEEGAAGSGLRDAATAWTVQSNVAFTPRAPYRVQATGGYRVRRVTDFFRVNRGREDTESAIVQVDATARPWNRAVEVRALYDAITERTPTLQEVYIRTGPELGQFVWEDADGDGVQQIDEFIPETTPNEGEYVQSFVPSDSLESVISLDTRFRLQLTPARVLESGGSWWTQALRSVQTRTEVEVREKSRTEDLASVYLMQLRRFRRPETTLDGQLRLSQDLALFRQARRLGIDVAWTQTRGLTERASGTERRFLNSWDATARWKPSPDWGLSLRGAAQTDRAGSEAFADTRSYDIDALEGEPTVSFQPAPSVRLVGSVAYAQKDESVQDRTAQVLRIPLRIEWSRAGRFQLSVNGELADVDLEGSAQGRAQFELTDGRGPGRSYLWGVQGRYVINQYLRATLTYDGRAPAAAPVIHTARLQLSASF